MFFRHDERLWNDNPSLSVGVLFVTNIDGSKDVSSAVSALYEEAKIKHGTKAESELPAIQAWRRAFGAMGLKPTQYRCASESLLRRFRKEGGLPPLHPVVDLCNAVSLLFAVPVAVFDTKKIDSGLEVCRAVGTEVYTPFAGEDENPEPGEVIFRDQSNRAHSRRWTNRQSGHSAVSRWTSSVLIVAEALHDTGPEDLGSLVERLKNVLTETARPQQALVVVRPGQTVEIS